MIHRPVEELAKLLGDTARPSPLCSIGSSSTVTSSLRTTTLAQRRHSAGEKSLQEPV